MNDNDFEDVPNEMLAEAFASEEPTRTNKLRVRKVYPRAYIQQDEDGTIVVQSGSTRRLYSGDYRREVMSVGCRNKELGRGENEKEAWEKAAALTPNEIPGAPRPGLVPLS